MPGPANRGSNFPNPQFGQQGHGYTGGSTGSQATLQEKPGDLASTVASKAEQAWDATRQGAQQAWDTTREGAQQAAGAVAQRAEDAFSDLRSCMARYPFATFGVGVGLGVLLALTFEQSFRRY
jgi:ElaB/YqjD/DUF883 family membrane-anchored ribosome-binding protein